jgi:16S rRNA U516 pseudouridylate synthase RsuA-like enzyme
VSFCGIDLDPNLKPGEWRYLTEEEEAILRECAK